ncbi:MAG: GNAT family N-acetyltransferase [Planctomycetes bacterium]|nr:GNAT family N-acetyltransferase [Planctomycetota bacterium]
MSTNRNISIRPPRLEDRAPLEAALRATGAFYDFEIAVALDLFDLSTSGRDPSYVFRCAELGGEFAGYMCFGEIPLTRGSYDLYWLAVDPRWGRRGIGHALVDAMMVELCERNGRKVYVETSSRAPYDAARSFYLRAGFRLLVTYADFYAPGDSKVVFERDVSPNR